MHLAVFTAWLAPHAPRWRQRQSETERERERESLLSRKKWRICVCSSFVARCLVQWFCTGNGLTVHVATTQAKDSFLRRVLSSANTPGAIEALAHLEAEERQARVASIALLWLVGCPRC